MDKDTDEEALRWGPEDEDYLPAQAQPSEVPEAKEREPGLGLTALLGGFYVMWGLAWVLGLASQPAQQSSGIFDAVMFGLGEFLAYIATPLWFVAVLWQGSSWSLRARAGALLVGLIVLLPWPFILPAVM